MSTPTTVQINKDTSYIVHENDIVLAANKVKVEHITVFQSPNSVVFTGTPKEVKDYIKKYKLSITEELLKAI